MCCSSWASPVPSAGRCRGRGHPRRISTVTATGTAPVSDYYLSWHLEQIRGDPVLHEALAVRADPLHVAAVFHLSTLSIATAIAYADIARALLGRPIETPSVE